VFVSQHLQPARIGLLGAVTGAGWLQFLIFLGLRIMRRTGVAGVEAASSSVVSSKVVSTLSWRAITVSMRSKIACIVYSVDCVIVFTTGSKFKSNQFFHFTGGN
jgi:hypothetical protein